MSDLKTLRETAKELNESRRELWLKLMADLGTKHVIMHFFDVMLEQEKQKWIRKYGRRR